MQLLVPVVAFIRCLLIDRQFRRIQGSFDALPQAARTRLSTLTLREIGQAAACEFPHLYGTPPTARYLPWGLGTAAGYTRAGSDNPEIALRGIAQWLAVAYHETKDSPYAFVQARHRQLLRVVKELKDVHGSGSPREQEDTAERWMQSGAAA
ncbi:hypothetical protein [Fulvimonas yonginensis]|uniref:Uncharacterized protein n=1 Tax=Fulvimonas yonginensis TaxID=1495200 RepID=A0ABU8JDH0_9GAMM